MVDHFTHKLEVLDRQVCRLITHESNVFKIRRRKIQLSLHYYFIGWPKEYQDNKNCIWILNAPTGQQIELTVNVFELEPRENCAFDFLQIRYAAVRSN